MKSLPLLVLLGLLSCAFVASSASAVNLDPLFQALKDRAVDYQPIGAICEQVARLKLQEKYPPDQFTVETGIAYYGQNRVIGELDEVVFRNSDHEVILIGEVKCWKSLQGAKQKATEQRARFQRTMDQGIALDLYLVSQREVRFNRAQFDEHPPFISISQDGGQQAGFDMTIGLSLDEAMRLRQRMIDCQASRECASLK